MSGSIADMFVGVVAVALGLAILLSSATNWQNAYRLRKTRWLEARLGRSGARVVLAVLGVALIALGVAIAMGFAPNASR